MVTSLNWGRLLGEMTSPSQESFEGRSLRHVLDLQGILHLAQRVQSEVHETVEEVVAVSRGEGMEETLVNEGSVEGSSSEEETKVPGGFQDAQDDFFA